MWSCTTWVIHLCGVGTPNNMYTAVVYAHMISLYTILSVYPSMWSSPSMQTWTSFFLLPLLNPVYSCPWANTGSSRYRPTLSFDCPCPLLMVTQKAALTGNCLLTMVKGRSLDLSW